MIIIGVKLKNDVIALVSGIFAVVETFFFAVRLLSSSSCESAPCSVIRDISNSQGPSGFLSTYSLPLALGGWFVFGIVLWRGRIPSIWRRTGFDKEVYDLMIKMRGSHSRIQILHQLDKPRHRNELSELTGLDWKEVDRQLGLLERHGLVRLLVQSGAVRIYALTDHGKLLLSLINELENGNFQPPIQGI